MNRKIFIELFSISSKDSARTEKKVEIDPKLQGTTPSGD